MGEAKRRAEAGGAWRPYTGQPIEKLYAWVATEPDGGEGICSHELPYMGVQVHMPLIGADMDRIRSLRPFAEKVRALTGYPVRLIQFNRGEDLEVLP